MSLIETETAEAYKAGKKDGYAQAMKDIQPLVEALEYQVYRKPVCNNCAEEPCAQHRYLAHNALVHFRNLTGEKE